MHDLSPTPSQDDFARSFVATTAVERCVILYVTWVCMSLYFASLVATLLLLARHNILVTPGTAGVCLAYASPLLYKLPGTFLFCDRLQKLLAGTERIIEYAQLPPEEPIDAASKATRGWMGDG